MGSFRGSPSTDGVSLYGNSIRQDPVMATLTGVVQPAVPALQGFDTTARVTPSAARAFRSQGFAFCIRYLSRTAPRAEGDLSATEAEDILGGGLSLMAIQHASRARWIPTAALGAQYGQAARENAQSVGLPSGMNIWLDLEGVRAGVAGEEVIAYCNAWFDAVTTAKYRPGIYIGSECGLSDHELFWRLKTQHYWRSGSQIPDVPHRGYQIIQRISPAPDIVNGIAIDRDVSLKDELQGTPFWLSPAIGAREEERGS